MLEVNYDFAHQEVKITNNNKIKLADEDGYRKLFTNRDHEGSIATIIITSDGKKQEKQAPASGNLQADGGASAKDAVNINHLNNGIGGDREVEGVVPKPL